MKNIRFKKDTEFTFEEWDEDGNYNPITIKIEKGRVYKDTYGEDIEDCYVDVFHHYRVNIFDERYGDMSICINPSDIEIF